MSEIPRARLYAEHQPAAAYAVLHPVAARPDKTWPADGFRAVASHLKQSLDLEPIFIGGTADNLARFHPWRVIEGAPLSAIKSLLQSAMLFIGNDSGPAHMAAAFGVPSVVIFGASDPAIWGPWRTPSEVLTDRGGISAISIEHVWQALTRLRVAA